MSAIAMPIALGGFGTMEISDAPGGTSPGPTTAPHETAFETPLAHENGGADSCLLQALVELGACDWARKDLAWEEEICGRSDSNSDCSRLNEDREGIQRGWPHPSCTCLELARSPSLPRPSNSIARSSASPILWRWTSPLTSCIGARLFAIASLGREALCSRSARTTIGSSRLAASG